MIFVEAEPKAERGWPSERCCFCRVATNYWTLDGAKVTGKSVACCPPCAHRAFREDLPTKEQWMRNERIADHSYRGMENPPLPPKPVKGNSR